MMVGAFVARVSRWRSGLLVLGSLVFIAAGVFVLGIHDPERPMLPFWGWAGIIFASLTAVAWTRQLFQTEPVLEIDGQGILYRRWSDDRIPWSAIARAEIGLIRRQKFLSLWLRDPDRYQSTRLLGKVAKGNKLMGFGDIALNLTGTDQSFESMLRAVERFAPELVRPRA